MATSEEEEIIQLRETIEELTSDLLESQDQLLSLTEKENDVPEKTIKDAYLAIIRGVNSWIDDVSGHKEFTFGPKWLEHRQSSRRRESLEDLGLNARCLDITWQQKLGEKPSAHYTFLSLAILKLKSRERQRDEADEILKRLTRTLEEWLDPRVLQDRKKTLQQYVIDPAIEFAQLAGCARKKYILEVENFVGGPVPNGSSWTIRDVSNWRHITPQDARGVFHCLWPMLVRKGIGSQSDNQLVQPIMIGFLADADLDLPEAPPSVALRESARSTKQRSEEPARSRKSSPSKKPSSAKHGGRPADKEQSWIRSKLPGGLTSSSSKSRDRPVKPISEGGKHSTWPLNAEQDLRRSSIDSLEGVVGSSQAYPTDERRAHLDQDEEPRYDGLGYVMTSKRQF
ncbi:hypothetical protein G7054_g9759 [Neopestalotiopsis clavispora]|nr:hypothetical protein G7054_g9759 [Neopestalotiopsis clavispora]